jgi:hypothetical protein
MLSSEEMIEIVNIVESEFKATQENNPGITFGDEYKNKLFREQINLRIFANNLAERLLIYSSNKNAPE